MGIDQYMEMGIKALIEAYPQVGKILERYGIACVTCTEGTCKLKEVVQFHALAPQDESAMMRQIERVITSEGAVEIPEAALAAAPVQPAQGSAPAYPSAPTFSYSPPVRRLVDEHRWIKRLLAAIPDLVAEMQLTGQIDADLLRATVDFIRGYADRYHHMKEEDVLFDYTDPQAKMVQVILQDHTRARGIVADIDRAVKEGDLQTLCARLTEYRALLTEHITKEDEVLYPYIDRGLTVSQVGEIYRRFEEGETQVPEGTREKYERFITDLTVRYEREMALS